MKLLIATGLLAFATAAMAQAPQAPATATSTATVAGGAVHVAEPAKPARKPRAAKAPAAPNPNLVEAKTSTGKTIHYDCSKKGNKTKTACKK